MSYEIRLTKVIHNFVRGQLNCEESIQLLEEIIDSDKWLNFLETDILLFEMATREKETKPMLVE